MNLLRACPCPVWIIKNSDTDQYKKIMAAVDLKDDVHSCNSELNTMILDLSSGLALAHLASLHVVNIYDVPYAGYVSLWADDPDQVDREIYNAQYQERQLSMGALMDSLQHRIGEKSFRFLSPQTHVVKGDAAEALPRVAEDIKADLVVMGTIARTGIAGVVIGNTAETVIWQLNCSVLAIKPAGFVSPIP